METQNSNKSSVFFLFITLAKEEIATKHLRTVLGQSAPAGTNLPPSPQTQKKQNKTPNSNYFSKNITNQKKKRGKNESKSKVAAAAPRTSRKRA